jgi:hypothetical protein
VTSTRSPIQVVSSNLKLTRLILRHPESFCPLAWCLYLIQQQLNPSLVFDTAINYCLYSTHRDIVLFSPSIAHRPSGLLLGCFFILFSYLFYSFSLSTTHVFRFLPSTHRHRQTDRLLVFDTVTSYPGLLVSLPRFGTLFACSVAYSCFACPQPFFRVLVLSGVVRNPSLGM